MLQPVSELYPARCDKGLFHFRGGIMLHMPQSQVTVLKKVMRHSIHQTCGESQRNTKKYSIRYSTTGTHEPSWTRYIIFLQTRHPHLTTVTVHQLQPVVHLQPHMGQRGEYLLNLLGFFGCFFGRLPAPSRVPGPIAASTPVPISVPAARGQWGRATEQEAGDRPPHHDPSPGRAGCICQKASISRACQL